MSEASPDEIWEAGLDEGERRLTRGNAALGATGFAGGADVFLGLVAVIVTTGALLSVMPDEPAHVIGSATFGLALVLITLGRAELFTENFLIPVSAVYAGRAPLRALLSMWGITFLFNGLGLLLFAAIFSHAGVLEKSALEAAGTLADTQADRDVVPALLSAIGAGTVMTLFTWVAAATASTSARVIAALGVGFLLLAPSLNHAVVSFGEILFGLLADTADAGWGDLARNTSIAVVGNLIGGVGLVFATRLAQVRGEPDSDSGASSRGR
ncbi:MAG: formate/nitrite transporter family protein [Thermoleophilaceae bacterium]|nr:formate/nitrite transporter family protein [Thermoleophilaceae bacterium]